ncbi:MAG: hypothetical protein HYS86_05130 [Candidatus Chisholmbacteria bacterium]|nr:hypothetical protein [Candidatus Chisholmbacteria bacterium]
MSFSLTIIIIFIIGSSWWIYRLQQKFSHVILHLILLLSTPWIIVLGLSRPSLHSLPASQPRLARIAANANFFSSSEFLFFSGDRRPGYGIIGHGVFLPSFLPLIAFGLLTAAKHKGDQKFIRAWLNTMGFSPGMNARQNELRQSGNNRTEDTTGVSPWLFIFLVRWLIGGLIISIITSNHPTLPEALWFVPSLSLLGTFGLYSFIDLIKKSHQPVVRSASFVALTWLVYEAARLYYILLSWQPFTLSS